jgi:hypothetical protein
MTDNRIIKTYWEGPLSKMEILSIQSFLANGHAVYLYTYDKKIKSFDPNMTVIDASEIIPQKRRPEVKGISTIFSDLFRYHLLQKTGGWWMDLDIVLLKAVSTKMPIVASLCFCMPEGQITLNNAPLKIPKGHPLADACIRSAESENLGKLHHGQLSGDLVQRQITKLQLDHFVVTPEVYSPIGWGEAHKLVEPNFGFNRIVSSTVAIHLFGNMWSRGRKMNKNAKYPDDSLYEWLKRKYSIV